MDKIFKALSDKNRRKILTLLKDNEMSVNEMLKSFEIGQATLSNHLAILRKADLVKNKVMGKQRIYEINNRIFDAFVDELLKFRNVIRANTDSEIVVRGSGSNC